MKTLRMAAGLFLLVCLLPAARAFGRENVAVYPFGPSGSKVAAAASQQIVDSIYRSYQVFLPAQFEPLLTEAPAGDYSALAEKLGISYVISGEVAEAGDETTYNATIFDLKNNRSQALTRKAETKNETSGALSRLCRDVSNYLHNPDRFVPVPEPKKVEIKKPEPVKPAAPKAPKKTAKQPVAEIAAAPKEVAVPTPKAPRKETRAAAEAAPASSGKPLFSRVNVAVYPFKAAEPSGSKVAEIASQKLVNSIYRSYQVFLPAQFEPLLQEESASGDYSVLAEKLGVAYLISGEITESGEEMTYNATVFDLKNNRNREFVRKARFEEERNDALSRLLRDVSGYLRNPDRFTPAPEPFVEVAAAQKESAAPAAEPSGKETRGVSYDTTFMSSGKPLFSRDNVAVYPFKAAESSNDEYAANASRRLVGSIYRRYQVFLPAQFEPFLTEEASLHPDAAPQTLYPVLAEKLGVRYLLSGKIEKVDGETAYIVTVFHLRSNRSQTFIRKVGNDMDVSLTLLLRDVANYLHDPGHFTPSPEIRSVAVPSGRPVVSEELPKGELKPPAVVSLLFPHKTFFGPEENVAFFSFASDSPDYALYASRRVVRTLDRYFQLFFPEDIGLFLKDETALHPDAPSEDSYPILAKKLGISYVISGRVTEVDEIVKFEVSVFDIQTNRGRTFVRESEDDEEKLIGTLDALSREVVDYMRSRGQLKIPSSRESDIARAIAKKLPKKVARPPVAIAILETIENQPSRQLFAETNLHYYLDSCGFPVRDGENSLLREYTKFYFSSKPRDFPLTLVSEFYVIGTASAEPAADQVGLKGGRAKLEIRVLDREGNVICAKKLIVETAALDTSEAETRALKTAASEIAIQVLPLLKY